MRTSTLIFLLVGLLTGARAQQPNVLFIAVDDLRPELYCYGATHMVTPNIDALAAGGRLFRNHYVAVPTCGASRYALMTGLRPTSSTDDNNAFNQMPTSLPSVAESWVDLLRRNDWHTASIGKLTHEPDGYRWNFPNNYDIGRSQASNPDMRFSWNEIVWDHDKWGAQRYPLFAYADGTGRVRNQTPAFEIGIDANGASLPDDAYPDGQMAAAAIEKLREYSDDGQRFCLAVGFHKPHLPFNAPKKYFDLYDPANLPPANPTSKPSGASSSTTGGSGEPNAYTSIGNRDVLRHAYFASVSYMDAQVGKVLDELEALGLADNTIVVLWGDHGWCLDDYSLLGKHVVLEHGVESPLIIRAPGDISPQIYHGVPSEGVVETIDIYPTIIELCGLARPAGIGGSSLVPMLRNPFAPGKSHAYSRFGGVTTVRTPDWRLISSGGVTDLYDLSTFRYEVADVSASNPDVVTDLSSQLTAQSVRTGTVYSTWANGRIGLEDPEGDADGDQIANALEYSAGSDPLNAISRPSSAISFEDLSAIGLGASEAVFSFTTSTAPNDLTSLPSASTDLSNWSSSALEFLDAINLNDSRIRLRFRLGATGADSRFFRSTLSD
ncbi:MAG: arylsulfatase A-like enzyme [Verrucomicrobiales bacterium]|jgi:arylsulfatase A-like enzyme